MGSANARQQEGLQQSTLQENRVWGRERCPGPGVGAQYGLCWLCVLTVSPAAGMMVQEDEKMFLQLCTAS